MGSGPNLQRRASAHESAIWWHGGRRHRGHFPAEFRTRETAELFLLHQGQPTTAVWYYEHPYPNGAKSYNKGKPIRIEEFEPERTWWDHRTENEQAWRVSIDQIKAGNYNLDLKNPHVSDTGPGDVDHLLPEYENARIAITRAELRAQLQKALTR